ncbi:MAG: hypothetical protein V3V30_02915 [Parvularculaceae bacterium]
MKLIRNIIPWLIASGLGYVVASLLSSYAVLRSQAALGYPVPVGDWPLTMWRDFTGLWAYLLILLVTFAVAFLVAGGLKLVLKLLAPVAYPIAGGVGVAVTLWLMGQQFGTIPITSANSTLGMGFQIVAGVFAGLVFERLRSKH